VYIDCMWECVMLIGAPTDLRHPQAMLRGADEEAYKVCVRFSPI